MFIDKLFIKKVNIEAIVIFFAVFLSSFVGAQFLGVSLNKIALIPLELYVIYKCREKFRINSTQRVLLLWYIFAIVSSVQAFLTKTRLEGKNEKISLFFFQVIVIYIPIILCSNCLNNPKEILKKSLVFVAKMNSLWALIQFMFWYGLKMDINSIVFNDLLKGILGTNWTVWNYEAGTLALRVSGFNNDSAFFALIMILGFCLTDKIFWKIFFFAMCVLSMSRTGIVVLCIITLLEIFKNLKYNKKHNKKMVITVMSVFFALIVVCFFAYTRIPSIKYQVDYALFRLLSIFNNSDSGTVRHMNYPNVAINIWINDFSIIHKLFGVGPRIGGLAFSNSSYANSVMSMSNQSVWAIECDFAELLMGHGLLGLIIYYVFIKAYKSNKDYSKCILAVFIMGIMYNVIETTLFQLLLIILITNSKRTNKTDIIYYSRGNTYE